MAGTKIRIEHNAEEILAVFARLQAAEANNKALWKDVGEHLQLSHRYRFDLAISPEGDLWEALDPEYQARKKKNEDEILVLDAFLRDQLVSQPDADGLDFGTSRIYGATHQFGDPDRGIPARPWLGVSEDDAGEILRLAKAHLKDAIGPGA